MSRCPVIRLSLTLPPVLSSLGVKPSQAAKSPPEFSGAKAAEAAPTPSMLSLESSSSFVIVLLSISAIFSTIDLFQRPLCTRREMPATQAS